MLKFEDRVKNTEILLKYLIINKKIKLDHNETDIVNIDSDLFTTNNIKIELLDLSFTVNIQVTYIDLNGVKCTPVFQQHEIYNLCFSIINSLSKSIVEFNFLYDDSVRTQQLYHKHFKEDDGDNRIKYIESLYKKFNKLLIKLGLIKRTFYRIGYVEIYVDHANTVYHSIKNKTESENIVYRFNNISVFYFIFSIILDYCLEKEKISKNKKPSFNRGFSFIDYTANKDDIDYIYIYHKITSIYNKELLQIQESK